MYTVWTKHIKDPEEKAQFEKSVHHSKWILEHLDLLLKEMNEDLDNYETTTKQYDCPNWDVRQADNNGFKRCLKAVRKIINLDNKDERHDRQSIER